jgi:hypothetical protein
MTREAAEAGDGAVGVAADGVGALQPAANGAITIASHSDAERTNRVVSTPPSESALMTTSITRIDYHQGSDAEAAVASEGDGEQGIDASHAGKGTAPPSTAFGDVVTQN